MIGEELGRTRPRWLDAGIAVGLAAAAALAYSLTFHPDWIYDPLRYAELMQRGPARILLGPQHPLGNLLPYAVFRGARGLGYGGRAMPVLAGFSVAGTAFAVGATYLAAVRLGGSRLAAATAAAVLAAAAAPWRAGGSGGVYGVALAALGCAWLLAARFVRAPGTGSAALLGLGAGVAMGAHLENLAFVGGAVVLVALLTPPAARSKSLGAFALALMATAGAIALITAGWATGWSLAGMRHWFLHPGIGGSVDRSSLVGWGVGGLFGSIVQGQPHLPWLPLGFDRAGHLGVLVTVVALSVAVVRGALLAARSRVGAILAASLALNAGLAFLLASWYQALRSDYWGLGLLPLAVMAGAGTVWFRRRSAVRRGVAAATAVALVAGMLAWNASQEVAPSLRLSHAQARAALAVAARAPRDSHVVVSLFVAGRLADDGYRAQNGFAALQAEIQRGAPKPGVSALAREAATRPVYVSSSAFVFPEGQARFLGANGQAVWAALQRCCRLEEVLRTRGLPADETIYRLRPR